MEVVVLGTTAPAGWPRPGCRCASCAAQRRAGDARGPTCVLVDGAVLLGEPPDLPRAAAAAARDLAGVRTVLHADRPPTDERSGRHTLRGLDTGDGRCAHEVVAPDGRRLLWWTGSGQPPAATRRDLAGRAYDVVLLAAAHDRAPHRLADLRAAGAVTDRTRVVLLDLDHDGPPLPERARQAAAWGAGVVPDGTVLTVGRPDPDAGRLPTRTLVLGGARSGKSAEAERRLLAEPRVTYVATGGRREGDAEWAARVAAHRARRPDRWDTAETLDVAGVIRRSSDRPVLVDCLSLWLTAVLDAHGAWDHGRTDGVERAVADLLDAYAQARVPVVVVSNEVGSGVVPATPSGRLFRDELGRLNARVAAASDEVLLAVAGRVLRL